MNFKKIFIWKFKVQKISDFFKKSIEKRFPFHAHYDYDKA